MGARQSIHAGNAKVEFNVDISHKLCNALLLPHATNANTPFSMIMGSLSVKHPSLFGGREKLDLVWDKGLYNSNVFVAFRPPRPKWMSQPSLFAQHSIAPEIGVHGLPANDFSSTGSGGVNLSRFSLGVDLNEPTSSRWSTRTSIKFEHIRPIDDDGHSISRDHDGFPITCSGNNHDNMVIFKQETHHAIANDHNFSRLSFQMEQGLPLLSKCLIFNRFKLSVSKGAKLGAAFLVTSLTGGSIVGDMGPYQAFSIGGIGSVRGYGEGAVGTGRSCIVANTELTFPLTTKLDGAIFMDYGTDLGSARHVPVCSRRRQELCGARATTLGFVEGVNPEYEEY